MAKKRADPEPTVLTVTELAQILGLTARSVRQYIAESRPGSTGPRGAPGRYINHPFPPPDGHIGSAAYWLPARVGEIRAWDAARVGAGAGGGRPRVRVTCHMCDKPGLELDGDGNIRGHYRRLVSADGVVGWGTRCPASGRPPRKARKAAH